MGAGGDINGRLNVNGSLYVNGKLLDSPSNYGVTYVRSLSDLPTPVNSIITLSASQSYLITNRIDLSGNRIVTQLPTSIYGINSDISRITSTGLNPDMPLLSTTNDVFLRDLTFQNNATMLALESATLSNNAFLNRCIFRNCSSLGLIKNYDTSLFDTIFCYNVGGMKFDGTMATVTFFQSIISTYPNTTGVTLLSTAFIGRKFRLSFMSFVNSDSTSIGINVLSGATIPAEGFILEAITFSPSGTAVLGISSSDNRAEIINCTNIKNSSSVAQLFMSANSVPTTIPNTTSFFKMSGTSLAGPLLEKFSISNNRITYTGTLERGFLVTAAATVTSSGGNDLIVAVGKNGVVENFSWGGVTAAGGGAFVGVTSQVFISLKQNDFLEFFVRNTSGNNAITVANLNMVLRSVN